MSGYVCPCCGEISNVFSTGGGEEMARREGLKFLGSLPVDTELVTLLDAAEVEVDRDNEGTEPKTSFDLMSRYQKTSTAPLFAKIVGEIERTLHGRGGSEDHSA